MNKSITIVKKAMVSSVNDDRKGDFVNKEFVKKIIKAEKLKYEAIKEILPINLRERVETFEKDAFNLLKDVAFELIKEDAVEENRTAKKTTKKVKVDFTG